LVDVTIVPGYHPRKCKIYALTTLEVMLTGRILSICKGIVMNKNEVLKKIREKHTSADLDDHVHELKSQEAAEINNRGVDFQLHYLMTECGQSWLEKMFLGEE